MKIYLSKNCESFTGMLNRRWGYAIQRQKGLFVSKRNSNGYVPPDGHLRFIFGVAKIVPSHLYFSDIDVSLKELKQAFNEAQIPIPESLKPLPPSTILHTYDILDLK